MSKPIRTLTLPALMILFANCSKQVNGDPHQVYAGVYRAQHTIAIAKPVLYAKGFQTSDTAFIQSFLQRKHGPEIFWFNESSVTIPDSFAVFNFRSADSLDITGTYGYYGYTRSRLVAQTGEAIIIQSLDTLPSLQMGDCDAIFLNMVDEKAISDCGPVAPSTGYNSLCRIVPRLRLQKDKDELQLPVMAIFINGNGCSFNTYKWAWGALDPSVTASFETHDTMVVQAGIVRLSR